MRFNYSMPTLDERRITINNAYRMDEGSCIDELIEYAELSENSERAVKKAASALVAEVRKQRLKANGIDSFLSQYALSSDEGVALMCLAEALLRIPDKATIDLLIKDKLSSGDWQSHLGQSESLFVNASTWGLMLTGKVLRESESSSKLNQSLKRLVGRTGEPMIRKAVEQAMRIMSRQFVMGRSIKEALKRAKKNEAIGYRYSYDMLGEAARTDQDAKRYFLAYQEAITAIGKAAKGKGIFDGPGISIKLSALHPRYEVAKRERVLSEVCPQLLKLAQLAKSFDIALTIDAEEAVRLDLSLDIIENVFIDKSLDGWNGFGMALQSYQKRAFEVIDWIAALAKSHGRRMMVRLIKGAYWDSEIKESQMEGLDAYPVFTRKCFTDVSFQACAKKILGLTDAIYPQFATHNAYSVAMILTLAGEYRDFEFQCLHGMGEELYHQIVPKSALGIPCRIYAPVGSHEDLLPYLVRRLLENGANSSFVNQIVDRDAPLTELVADPVIKAKRLRSRIGQNIPLPVAIFGSDRKNSQGVDVSSYTVMQTLEDRLNDSIEQWQAKPLLHSASKSKPQWNNVYSPSDKQHCIGQVAQASETDIASALNDAEHAYQKWTRVSVANRADCLLKMADLLEAHRIDLMAILVLEAGKTLGDAIAEVREAVDFCRYYAKIAEEKLAPTEFHAYTGESNVLTLHGRGVMLCISPWNFPLAIFLGQISACLVSGNAVIAKPAEQTPLIAARAVELFHQAGVPTNVLQCLPGSGESVGAALVASPIIQGVLFTGSTQTARLINQSLANRHGAIVPLIAETGGQNAMIVDSSALLEQVVVDVINSAFGSAGQRCSALRVLYVQQEVAPRFIELLQGAMAELSIGDPCHLDIDVGPVIDQEALGMLTSHAALMEKTATEISRVKVDDATLKRGHFFAPRAYQLESLSQLPQEVFGPVLHVITFARKQLDQVIADINNTGYGLTLGIHSRIDDTVAYIQSRVHVGNTYVNRNMIGAVVGLQPFGGEGLSGTGPKAGGPQYLSRLCHERTVTVDTTAAGGNASLMSLEDESEE